MKNVYLSLSWYCRGRKMSYYIIIFWVFRSQSNYLFIVRYVCLTPNRLRRGTGCDPDPKQLGKRKTISNATLSSPEWLLHKDGHHKSQLLKRKLSRSGESNPSRPLTIKARKAQKQLVLKPLSLCPRSVTLGSWQNNFSFQNRAV